MVVAVLREFCEGGIRSYFFRYFKLDMSLKTAKYKWQEIIWIGGSEGVKDCLCLLGPL